MDSSTLYLVAADAVLLLHILFVAFVVLGLLLIFIGNARGWSWVCNPWFRLAHLIAISVVVILSWFGIICPLTTIEMELRLQGGGAVYPGSFISHWLETLLYYRLPTWVFIVCYMIFGTIVAASWFWIPPRRFK